MDKKDEVKKILSQFTPDQQAFTQHVAELKIQNKVMTKQISDLKAAYDQLYQVFIILLEVDKDHEMRIHESQFLRFKDEYRIDRFTDQKTKEIVFKLRTLTEDIGD